MKKRICSVILLISLLVMGITGCGNGNGQTDTEKSSQTKETTAISYDYGQELNIIDDNYRNYYEIFVYSFYDSDGDGIGDLNGVTKKLDYIEEMGFNGIWLMPVMPSPSYHKYDVYDYCDIDPVYGEPEDFEHLAEECHNRGIRLVVDFVMNHTSSQHPWFQEACQYLKDLPQGQEPDVSECPYFGYYHFTKEKTNETYYAVPGTDWYYEGSFWSEMPDLDLENETVVQEFEEIAKFWMDLGADGFRMDAAMHYVEAVPTKNASILNHLYNYCLAQNPDFYMVSEVWSDISSITEYYKSKTPSMFNFVASGTSGVLEKTAMGMTSANGLVTAMANYQETFSEANPEYIDAPFLTNHDMSRAANNLRSDENDIKMAAGLLMMMNGSPFVYYGEEIGMKSSGDADENKRTAMRWSDTDTAGMTKGPADADQNIEQVFSTVEEQLQDETSILNYYKRAIRLRNENPEIARGTISVIQSLCSENTAAITKTYEESTIGIVYNTADEKVKLSLSETGLEKMEIRGYLTLNGEIVELDQDTLILPPQSICILK